MPVNPAVEPRHRVGTGGRDIPILFSAPMVRALLAGTKTQTRRLLKPQPAEDIGLTLAENPIRFAAGDRLWVREAWRVPAQDDQVKPRDLIPQIAGYEADCGTGFISATGRLRPGMFMPRWASRLTLHVTEVRVQRLQDISADDAEAEGVDCSGPVAINCYRDLWNQINGAGSWDANPWVVAVSFTVERANIDHTPTQDQPHD